MANFLAAIAVICTNAPYLPTDRPAMTENIIPSPLATKVFHDKNFYKLTPAKIAFNSGTPDPSASLLMYSLKRLMFSKYSEYPTLAVKSMKNRE